MSQSRPRTRQQSQDWQTCKATDKQIGASLPRYRRAWHSGVERSRQAPRKRRGGLSQRGRTVSAAYQGGGPNRPLLERGFEPAVDVTENYRKPVTTRRLDISYCRPRYRLIKADQTGMRIRTDVEGSTNGEGYRRTTVRGEFHPFHPPFRGGTERKTENKRRSGWNIRVLKTGNC
jgi:hypothetical protein